ncbi:MAG: hypothetical protein PUI52_03290 [Bacteroidales bacterium]|nr:hypothetical protein [Bacteroidales bacterium]MDY4562515.1 hypothetical protein [Candidatus Cryptobacteroides sp.]MDY6171375.1 hypothetical protein [Candidatus Cryptobacteroides sp.]
MEYKRRVADRILLGKLEASGAVLIDEGASSLKSLSSKIDTDRMKKPSFLMVLTGIGEYAYKRPEDGVFVVPVGCLKD